MRGCQRHAWIGSVARRVTRAAIGLALLLWGETHEGFAGLLLMMLGLVPIVTAAADICLLTELRRAWPAPPAVTTPDSPHLPA